MHKIVFNQKVYSGPSRWDELSAAGLLHFARVVSRLGISAMANHILIMLLMDIPYKEFKRLKEFQLLQLHCCVSWLFESNALSRWLLKSVKTGTQTLYGPADKLANISGNEFMFIEQAYECWLKDQNRSHLDLIFAVLYQKKYWLTGKRLAFKADNLSAYIHQTSSVSTAVKYAVAVNYAGCRNLIIQNHPHIWKKAQAQQTPGSKTSVTSWASIFLQLAGDKFGTYEQTISTKVWLLLADLDTKAKQAQEMEAKYK